MMSVLLSDVALYLLTHKVITFKLIFSVLVNQRDLSLTKMTGKLLRFKNKGTNG